MWVGPENQFSERGHGHITYKIKGNEDYITFKQKGSPYTHPLGGYRAGLTEIGKENSRTIPGLFSFFKDSTSSQFCIKQREKMHFFQCVDASWDDEELHTIIGSL